MSRHIEGDLLAGEEQFAIVVSRFNEIVTRLLLGGAINSLTRHGVADDHITVVWVPGAFEIPQAAERLAQKGRYAAICCLGAVIQGETTHHEYINQQVVAGIAQTSRTHGVPVLYGVLTCQTLQQALDRAGCKAGNKGTECALAAIEMVNLLKKLDDEKI